MGFRKDELEEMIHTYGLNLDESVTWDNEKMIKALGDYFISLTPNEYSWGARYVQSLNTLMLCNHLKDNLQYFDYNPVESEDYTVETKENGMRCCACYSPDTGFEFFSRNESVKNYLNGNFTDKYLFINKGLITEPKDYINAFNYRFVLDGELIVEGSLEDASLMGLTVEDFIQQILGSNPEKAKTYQKEEHRLKFVVFDVLYFEPNPVIPAEWTPVYNYKDDELTKEQIDWVFAHFTKYLEVGGFKSYGRAKPLFKYLYSLRNTNKYDVRRLPFSRRRELRGKIVNFLQKKNLPIFEVDYEDTYKVAFTDNILREGGEGCFRGNMRVNMADGTLKPISKMKVGDLVLSYNRDKGCLEPKRVTKVIYNGLKPISEYVSVSHGAFQDSFVANRCNRYHRIECTKNHYFFYRGEYAQINNISHCYELSKRMDSYRTQALYGWLLSDGYMNKDGIIQLSQKADSAFWEYTVDMFKEFTTKGHTRVQLSGKGSKIGSLCINKEYCIPFTKYKEDKISMIKQMNEIAWAYFIMGDGSKNKSGLTLSTESLPLDCVEAIINQLNKIIGEEGKYSIKQDKRVKKYGYSIYVFAETVRKIKEKVGKYVHESMRYKFNESIEDSFVPFPEVVKEIKEVPILKTPLNSYKNYKNRSSFGAWDIEVEDNHNYFVEYVLVHNSMLKSLHAPYISALRSNRNHRAAMKIKQSIASMLSEDMEEVKDFDVFILGATPPKSDRIHDMIGALTCGVYVKDENGETRVHEIAKVSGIPHEWKKKMASIDVNTGEISLNPEYAYKVIAINGLALTKSNLKFQHATLLEKGKVEFKAKNPSECTWDIEALRNMVITRGQ